MKTTPSASFGSFALTFLVALPAWAEDFYVATDGSDADGTPGTIDQPFASIERAQTAASPGDTVFIRGGMYRPTGLLGVSFTKDGTQSQPINYFATSGEVPVIDMSQVTPTNRVTGLSITADWIHIRGLEVTGVRQFMSGQDSWGVRIQASNNILENLNVHNNEAPGIFITSGANNLILNCDSHDNYDVLEVEATNGSSGDGFGCHSTGEGNVLRGCRAYENSDDGFDFINADGSCTVEYSWAFRNGNVPGTTEDAGDGAGFKLGGYGGDDPVANDFPAVIPRHVARFNVSFGNDSQGFYANHHPGPEGVDFINNTAFDNVGLNYDMLDVPVLPATNFLRNNVAFGSGGTIGRLTADGDDANNSWTLPVTVTDDDFLSQATEEALAARKADGSLPDVSFLHLAADSDLIDQGVDVGFPFAGSAPDLGAFEAGLEPTVTPTDPTNPGMNPATDPGGQQDPAATSPTPQTDPGVNPVTPTTPSVPTELPGGSGSPVGSPAATAPAVDPMTGEMVDPGALPGNPPGAGLPAQGGSTRGGCAVQPNAPRTNMASLLMLLGLAAFVRRRR